MGAQQLIQSIIAAIAIGILIIAGIAMFGSSATHANENTILRDLNQLTALARKHYRTPALLGGGSRSFKNFKIPQSFADSPNGEYEHINKGHNSDHIHFVGTGKEKGADGTNPIRIEFRVEIGKVKITKHN